MVADARQTDFCAYLSAIAGWSRPSMRVWDGGGQTGCSVDYGSHRCEGTLGWNEGKNLVAALSLEGPGKGVQARDRRWKS